MRCDSPDGRIRTGIILPGLLLLLAAFWLYEYLDAGRLLMYALHAGGYGLAAVASAVAVTRRLDLLPDFSRVTLVERTVSRNRFTVLIVLLGVTGIVLRTASFIWNQWLFGDVNLLALTAREVAVHGRLRYPMAYGPDHLIDWPTLTAWATQHPPLLPWIAGMAARMAGTRDTFTLLKVITEIGGIGLVFVLLAGIRKPDLFHPLLVTSAIITVSPLLVDFSANGSPYILAALILLLVCLLLAHGDLTRPAHYVLAGIVCGAGLQLHGVLTLIPFTFAIAWCVNRCRVNPQRIAVFAATLLITLLPWLAWNLRHTGSPFPLGGLRYLFRKLDSVGDAGPEHVALYLDFVKGTVHTFLRQVQLEVGPGGLYLAASGTIALWWHNRRAALAVLLPLAAYAAPTLGWPVFKDRFLVPFIPLIALLAGFGFAYGESAASGAARLLNRLALIVTVGWALVGYLDQPPTRYYDQTEERSAIASLTSSRSLGEKLAGYPQGTVLGYRGPGAMQGLYWHSFPLISFSGPPTQLREMTRVRAVRYLWVSGNTARTVGKVLPDAILILQQDDQFIYALP